MTTIAFDTLKLARKLEAAGFQPKQAGDTAEALAESLSELSGLATKEDVLRLESLTKEAELRLAAKIEATRSDTLKWMFGALAAQTAFLSLIKFFGH